MSHSRRLLFTLALTTLMSLSFFAASGCAGALMMPYYLIYGTDAPAKYKKVVKDIPKGSTIVVICRSNLNLYGSSSPDADLSQALTYVLSTQMTDVKKKKFVWISYDEVESKFEEDELTSQSFEKLGNALKADYVVGVEIDDFDVHHSTQFYQGKAKVRPRFRVPITTSWNSKRPLLRVLPSTSGRSSARTIRTKSTPPTPIFPIADPS